MMTTIERLRRYVRRIIKEGWGWENDAKVAKIQAQKRAEENKPWMPDTRTGTSTARQHVIQPSGRFEAIEDVFTVTEKWPGAVHAIVRNTSHGSSNFTFYADDKRLVAQFKDQDEWYAWVNGKWEDANDPRVSESRKITFGDLKKLIREEWGNDAILGKARERKRNPQVWSKKQATADFYAKPKVNAPEATGPDPTGEVAPKVPPAPGMTMGTSANKKLFPMSWDAVEQEIGATGVDDITNFHGTIDFYVGPGGQIFAHDHVRDEWFGWNYDTWVPWADPR